LRIDAHHHLWHYTPQDYGWIDDRMQLLRRDFLPADLEAEMTKAHIDASIAVQARQTLEETHWLLALAEKSQIIRGVTGWAPIADDTFPTILDQLRKNPRLKALRHVVQAEPDGFLDAPAFNRGITTLRETGLVYEILIFARQLPEAIRFVDRHPNQLFVLDHIAKPDIAGNGLAAWATPFRELAQRENVCCKLSGMVTEADWETWTPGTIAPYFETALEAFGPSRLMAGSDWPVINLACTYTRWWQIISQWLTPLTATDRQQIEAGTAARIYHLTFDTAPKEDTL
jgi:L-fuconolactonase